MKKKYIPSVLLLILCIGVLGVGVYAAQPTNNKITGTISVNAANALIEVSTYINGEPVFEGEETRSGIPGNILQDQIVFDTDKVNTVEELDDIVLTIKIKNKSNHPLGVYFYNVDSENYVAKDGEATAKDITIWKEIKDGNDKIADLYLDSYSYIASFDDNANNTDFDERKMNIIIRPYQLYDETKSATFDLFLNVEAYKSNIKAEDIAYDSTAKIGTASASGLVKLPCDNSYTTLAQQAFQSNSNIDYVVMPDTIKTLGAQAFAASAIKSICLSRSLSELPQTSFYVCKSLFSVRIPASISSFGLHVFRESSISVATFEPNENLTLLNRSAFFICPNLKVIDLSPLSNLDEIGNYAFGREEEADPVPGIVKITLPDSLTKIDGLAFYMCQNLTIINLSDSNNVATISEFAFGDCFNLKNFNFSSAIREIHNGAFQDTGLTSINLPEGLEFIGDFAFNHVPNATNKVITIPSTVKQIGGIEYVGNNNENNIVGSHAFYNCATSYLTRFEVAEGNTNFVSDEDGVLYTKDYKYLISYPSAKRDVKYEMKEGCEDAFELAFSRASYLKTLVLANTFNVTSSANLSETFLNKANGLSLAIYNYTSIEAFEVKEGNTKYQVIDGILYTAGDSNIDLVCIPTAKANKGTLRLDEAKCTTIIDIPLCYAEGTTASGPRPNTIVIGSNITSIGADVITHLNDTYGSKNLITFQSESANYTVSGNLISAVS